MDELKRAHKKKKKKHSRHSSESSDSGNESPADRAKKSRLEHKRKGESRRGDEKKHRKEHERSRHEREHRRRDVSPDTGERNRQTKDDKSRERQPSKHHRDKGERWEDEEKRYDRNPAGIKIKQEPGSDAEDRRGHRPEGHREFRGGRGGYRGGDRGRRGGRGRGNGIPWGRNREGGGEEDQYQWGRPGEQQAKAKPKVEKEKPNFGLSGKLTEDVNTINGVVIKYSEPPESRKPKRRWRLYVFKGEETLPTLYIHRQSAYLMGRDRKVADIPLDHPSISKQHAALQYRLVTFKKDDGIRTGKCIRPYIIDLESANGTYVNNKKIESKKYVELMEKDVLKFGYSSREYVLLHEHSQDTNSGDDDDVKEEEPNP